MSRESAEKIAGVCGLVAFIVAQFLFGITSAVRVLGILCVVSGAYWVLRGSVPVGIEGRPPAFYLRGASALIAGMAMAALGFALFVYSKQAACLLGWASQSEC